jgi:hypothetical protein
MHLPAQCRIEAALNHQPLPRVYMYSTLLESSWICNVIDGCDSDPCPTFASFCLCLAGPACQAVIRAGLTSPMTFRADDGMPKAGCLPPRPGDSVMALIKIPSRPGLMFSPLSGLSAALLVVIGRHPTKHLETLGRPQLGPCGSQADRDSVGAGPRCDPVT